MPHAWRIMRTLGIVGGIGLTYYHHLYGHGHRRTPYGLIRRCGGASPGGRGLLGDEVDIPWQGMGFQVYGKDRDYHEGLLSYRRRNRVFVRRPGRAEGSRGNRLNAGKRVFHRGNEADDLGHDPLRINP